MKILNDVMNNNIEEITNQENKQKVNASIIEAIFSENMAYISAEIENFDNAKGDENIDKIKLYAKEKERLEHEEEHYEEQNEQNIEELVEENPIPSIIVKMPYDNIDYNREKSPRYIRYSQGGGNVYNKTTNQKKKI